MVNDNLMLLEKDLSYAQKMCASIADRCVRNRTVANIIGTLLAESYFDPEVCQVDAASGLHNVVSVIENYEISDIYVNNFYIDVRVYFSEDEICVPKVHFDTGVMPVLYMFIKLAPDLKSAEVKGFVRPERVDKSHAADDVYYLSENDFESYYDVESKLMGLAEFSDVDETKIFDFLEGGLTGEEVISLLAELVKSKNARQKLIKCVNAQSVFNFVSVNTQIDDIQNNQESADITEDDLDSLFDSSSATEGNTQYSTSVTPSGAELIESLDREETAAEEEQEQEEIQEEEIPVADENSEQLEALFTGEQEGIPVVKPKKQPSRLLVFLVILLIAASGYYIYTNMTPKVVDDNAIDPKEIAASLPAEPQSDVEAVPQNTEEAMPVETVENNAAPVAVEEETDSTVIPAIEKSLDASVLVSNLKVDWEVPEGYAANTTAKRFLLKMGKVIQLNLKTELLLLQKPPLSNKITVEIKYNPVSRKFETVGIKDSSGEKTVDALILSTVNGVLKMTVTYNMDFISKIPGNPVLIIHL